uniref:Uncharacterized protein n=1 Tax=Cacopsylla melanoneura TaxID=428564 RepID=A0A8D9FIY2_9HEMI
MLMLPLRTYPVTWRREGKLSRTKIRTIREQTSKTRRPFSIIIFSCFFYFLPGIFSCFSISLCLYSPVFLFSSWYCILLFFYLFFLSVVRVSIFFLVFLIFFYFPLHFVSIHLFFPLSSWFSFLFVCIFSYLSIFFVLSYFYSFHLKGI